MEGWSLNVNLTAGNSELRYSPNGGASMPEEPGARKLHAGICAGRGRVTALSTATAVKQLVSRFWAKDTDELANLGDMIYNQCRKDTC